MEDNIFKKTFEYRNFKSDIRYTKDNTEKWRLCPTSVHLLEFFGDKVNARIIDFPLKYFVTKEEVIESTEENLIKFINEKM